MRGTVSGYVERSKLRETNKIKDYLKSFDFFERYVGNRQEGEEYVETHTMRLIKTLDYLPRLSATPKVLELGAIPYYMTVLLKRFYGWQIDTVSFYEVESAQDECHLVESREYGDRFIFRNIALNVERDALPFDDGAYDLVLCCEILEHLLINPSHMLSEIHRVLKPEGYLLLTTPNVARRGNLLALLRGRNIYDRYHGNGVYGRHNREYTVAELKSLLSANGFEISKLDLFDVYRTSALARLLNPRIWRDTIFILARPQGEVRSGFPPELYVLMDEYRNVIHHWIIMGRNDVGHLGRGWYQREESEFCYRWTGAEAEIFLKPREEYAHLCAYALCNHPDIRNNPISVKLVVDERTVDEKVVDRSGWSTLSFNLKGVKMKKEKLRLKLMTSRVWVPKRELGTDDERELGIAVSRIWLE